MPASATLTEVADVLEPLGFSLGIAPGAWARVQADPVGDWIAAGAEGARDPWLDPSDHLIAGFEAELPDGRPLVVRPAPRRATGPDLCALLAGARARFVSLRRVWLRIHDVAARVPATAVFHADRDPPVSSEEEELLGAIRRELA